MEEEVPGSANAGPSSMKPSPPHTSVLRAVELASQELSKDDLSSLHDPNFRTQAAKWRSGSGARRVSAAFARMLNALKAIKPGWVSDAQSQEMPLAEPLPIGAMQEAVAWHQRLWQYVYGQCRKLCMKRWWTMWLLLTLLLFPKFVAAVVALLFRLVIRLAVALVMRVCREVLVELENVLGQFSTLTQGLASTGEPS